MYIRVIYKANIMKHIEQQELAINSPESYWKEQSELVAWYKKPQTILSTNTDSWHDWFADGVAPYPVYSVATGELVQPEDK